MARSLADRMRALEQQKLRLANDEAKVKLAARKARNHKLFEAGGLVDKAGLLDFEAHTLYGALLSLKEAASETEQLAQWAARGGRSFAREARLRDAGKQPFVLTFPDPLPKDVTATLRTTGFRFSKVLRHWEGLATPGDAETLAAAHGGTLRRINPTAAADPTPNGRPETGDRMTDRDDDLLSRRKPS